MQRCNSLVGDQCRLVGNPARENDSLRREEKRLDVCASSLRENVVDLDAFVVQAAELLAVLREWAARVTDSRPGCVDVDRDPGNERGAIESRLRRLGENCAAPEGDDGRRPGERLRDDLLLDARGTPARRARRAR